MHTTPHTLQHAIYDQQRSLKGASGTMTDILTDLAVVAKVIANKVRQAGLLDILGSAGHANASGDEVQKLDVYANEVIKEIMSQGGHVCGMASEEEDVIIQAGEEGKYVLLFDPLDGSTNIDCNVGIGTIFALYQRVSENGPATTADILQPGINQVAAGYILYGSATMFIYTTGDGVDGFTLDPAFGEFVLSHPGIRIPEKGKIYSINEGNTLRWDHNMQKVLAYFKSDDRASARPYSSRYIGSMVADVHRTLVYGGVFMYPADAKSPQGKLRLLYEAGPMSMVIEQAGGLATNGRGRILEIAPTDLHQRTPLFLGSRHDVAVVQRLLA